MPQKNEYAHAMPGEHGTTHTHMRGDASAEPDMRTMISPEFLRTNASARSPCGKYTRYMYTFTLKHKETRAPALFVSGGRCNERSLKQPRSPGQFNLSTAATPEGCHGWQSLPPTSAHEGWAHSCFNMLKGACIHIVRLSDTRISRAIVGAQGL